jgi:Ca-activated chloride channel family protein
MGLFWPGFLILLGLIPLIVAGYIWILRRRRRFAVRYSSLALVRAALPQQSRWRRHIPFALFLLALASLVIALGRPFAVVQVPIGQTTIILAMDVSRSMCATDISPNRLEVAKDSALSFIERQTRSSQIGIVAFSGFAELIQQPTTDQEVLQDAVAGLATGRRTAIGSAILKSVDAIAEINSAILPSTGDPASGMQPTPVPEGTYVPDIIVLLTDGASNAGISPIDAAQFAVDRGIRVYTIGFGTENENASMPNCGSQFWGSGQFNNDPFGGSFGGGGGGGGRFRRGLDEPTLKQIASMTGGEYYLASSAGELQKVFEELPTYLITKEETMEISVAFTAAGVLLVALAVLLSMLWHPLP